MKEAWNPMWRTVREKSAGTLARVLLAATSVGIAAGCGVEFQSPIVFEAPTATSAPTPEPTLTPTPVLIPTPYPTPTRIPTATPRPTETPMPPPTPTITPEPRPTRTPVPTNTPEPTPIPTPTATATATPTPEPPPSPTHVPTATQIPAPIPVPPPTPTGVPLSEQEIGTERKFTKCFDNITTPTTRSSIDIETTGIEVNYVKFKGDKKFLKTEIKVPKTQKEIKKETEIARKKAIKEGKDPNAIVIEAKKIVPDGTAFDVDPGSVCANIKMHFRSGSNRDCYGKVSTNFKNRASGFNGRLLENELLLQNSCIAGVVKGAFEPNGYQHNQATNTVTAYFRIENPDQDTPQETKVKLLKPCSFLEPAGQEIVDNNTNAPISLNEPIKIPPKTSIWLRITSKMPFGKSPTFPLKCNAGLDRVLEK